MKQAHPHITPTPPPDLESEGGVLHGRRGMTNATYWQVMVRYEKQRRLYRRLGLAVPAYMIPVKL